MFGSHRLSRTAGVVLVASATLAVMGGPARAAGPPTPDFTFVPGPSELTLPAGDGLAQVADANGDGVPDLIVINRFGGSVGVIPGDGKGGFGALTSLMVGGRPTSVAAADFNGDGRPDLLVGFETASASQPSPEAEAAEVLIADGQGGFTIGRKLVLPEAGQLVVGDFNGDGHLDAAEVPGCSVTQVGFPAVDSTTIYMLPGDGRGALSRGPATSSPTHACEWTVGDFNGDGRQDLVIAAGPIVVRLGEPNGQFGAPIETAAPPRASFLGGPPTDLDGNHTLDLVAVGGIFEPSALFVLSGDGVGRFSFAGPYLSGSVHLAVTPFIGEFAAAGRPEIVTIGPSISLMEPDGNGGLTPVPVLANAAPGRAFVADLNKDGRSDVLLSSWSAIPGSPQAVKILLDQLVRPAIESATLSHRAWREGSRLALLSRRRPPLGTTLSFSLNVDASVRIVFTQLVHRRRGHVRELSRGALVLAAHAGTDRVRFDGRLSRAQRLPRGSYTMTLTASNAGGSSAPVTLRFRIVGARHRR